MYSNGGKYFNQKDAAGPIFVLNGYQTANPGFQIADGHYLAASKKDEQNHSENITLAVRDQMADCAVTILLVDDNPDRLSLATTVLILAGHSMLSVSSRELTNLLTGANRDWRIGLILIRASLDSATEELIGQQFNNVPRFHLSQAATLEVNLPNIVAGLLPATA